MGSAQRMARPEARTQAEEGPTLAGRAALRAEGHTGPAVRDRVASTPLAHLLAEARAKREGAHRVAAHRETGAAERQPADQPGVDPNQAEALRHPEAAVGPERRARRPAWVLRKTGKTCSPGDSACRTAGTGPSMTSAR